jgi:hypothetical protein
LIDKHFGCGIIDAGNISKFRFTIQKDIINELGYIENAYTIF